MVASYMHKDVAFKVSVADIENSHLKLKILIAYNNRRSYPFDEKYDIKNTISTFINSPFFKSDD